KPTPGRIPSTGHQPPCLGPFAIIGVVGPMARTIGDVRALFEATAGVDPDDPACAPVPIRASGRVRVGVIETDGQVPVTSATRAAVAAAAKAALDDGHAVDGAAIQGLDRARGLWGVFFAEIGRLLLSETLKGRESTLPILEEYAASRGSNAPPTAAFIHAWLERDELRASVLRQMETCPVLIAPVASIPAFRHGEREWTI